MRKFLRNTFSWFAFCLVAGLLLLSYNKYKFFGNGTARQKVDYFNKNSEKYNTLIIGSSRMYRQINPEILDSVTSHQI